MRGPRNGRGEKRPRARRARRGASRVRFASAVKTRGSRLPLRCPASSLAPIDKNAELLRVPCGARGYPPAGTINTPVQVEKLSSGLVQGSTSSVVKRSPRLATDDGTKGPPNNLSTAVFGRRKSTVSVMARKINRVDNCHGSGRPDKRTSGGVAREESPEAPNAERTADDQVMLDQGLRLNRAFISINDSLVREAIVNLVVEAAMSPPSDALRRVRSSTSLREAPTQRRPRM
jgi:hypothetical protein